MWRTGLLYLDRGDSAIIAALKDAGFNTQQTPGSPNRRFSQSSGSSHSREHSRDGRFRPDPIPAQQWVMPADSNGLKFASPVRPHKPEDVIDNFSPMSDSTLFEEPPSYSLDRIVEDEGHHHDYFNYDAKDKDDKEAAKHDSDETAANIQKRRASIRRQRAPSIPSTPTSPVIKSVANARRISRELPVRAKTSEGLLQLQANPSKPQRPAGGHKRRISLGLPIKAPTSAPETPVTAVTPSPRSATLSSRPNRTSEPPSPAALNQQERDLEYKHRHTFIGTASLDDFLEVLEVTPQHTCTKSAVGKAFIVLAASERLLARQASTNPAGWDLVPRVTPDVPNYDYVAQAHVRLGSITLWQFLELMPFDEKEEAGAMSVLEAFSAASHMDAKASTGIASKARIFRSWMVKQANALTGSS